MKLLILATIIFFPILVVAQINDADRVLKEMKRINDQVQQAKDLVLVYAKISGQSIPQKVSWDAVPDNAEAIYEVVLDQRQVIYFADSSAHDGDQYKYFFGNKGQTIVFEEQHTYTNRDCSNQPITATLTHLYLANFQRIGTIVQLRDLNGDTISGSDCQLTPDNWGKNKIATWKELLAAKQIVL